MDNQSIYCNKHFRDIRLSAGIISFPAQHDTVHDDQELRRFSQHNFVNHSLFQFSLTFVISEEFVKVIHFW